jgi:FkbH-like protein
MADNGVLRKSRQLVKEGHRREALSLLRAELRSGKLGAEQVHEAGRFLARELQSEPIQDVTARVHLLGQCTTSWLTHLLVGHAWGQGAHLKVTEGGYDHVLQELLTARFEPAPNVVVLLPWTQRLFGGAERPPDRRVAEEVAFWQQAWGLITKQLGARILQVGYDYIHPDALGCHLSGGPAGTVGLVRRTNEALRAKLPPEAYFVDLEQASGCVGRRQFYDARRYYWTKQPFSEAGAHLLVEHLWAGIRALIHGPKKVLVLDLDNTLWGGVVGETGPLGITLGDTPDGEAYRAFQKYAKELNKRGVVLAVSSKNNPEDARAPFEKNPAMVLSLSDFAGFEANWEPKAAALQRLACNLRLGLDSFVFFDDNPAERELIRQFLPEVEVVDVPEDPADYIMALQAGLWFEATGLSREDSERAASYQQELQREQLRETFATTEDYLRSLEMVAEVRPVNKENMQRVVQLLGKTNQFNLTTRRHSEEAVRCMIRQPDALGLTFSLRDRFGDHGLIAVVLAVPEDGQRQKTLRLDTWLMSCRVIARTMEEFTFNTVLHRAEQLGYEVIIGDYLPTKKNALVADLYDRLGFQRGTSSTDQSTRYLLRVSNAKLQEAFIHDQATASCPSK